MTRSDHVAIDSMLQDVLARASDGLQFERCTGAITDGVNAIAKQLQELSTASYKGMKPADIARCAANTVKSLDELFRLLQFAKGAPDSRPDLGGDWLRGLTGEQLATVQGWVEQANRAAAEAAKAAR